MTLLVFYVSLALGVSFLCSIMEAVLLSVTPSYVKMLEQRGNRLAGRLEALKADIDRPLAAILSLNTIAHTVGAAGAGAQATAVFGSAYVGVISAVLTLLILVISEIIPKTLGALYWEALTPVVVSSLRVVIWIMWPLVKLSQGITRFLARGRKQHSISKEELGAMAELAEDEGVVKEEESRILRNLLRFGSLRAQDIMTPRTVVFALAEDDSVGDVMRTHPTLRFSRIPVYRTDRDDVTGYVLKDELLLRAARDDTRPLLRSLRREIFIVPETLSLSSLFEQMLERTDQIALVVDEYGGMAGLVSMEDVVETLLGLEIVDEADSATDMQLLAREQWLRRARRLGIVQEGDPFDGKEPSPGSG
ncbi:MAG: HlyC/CorC family transporter [bacterium]|nr:HlyC/CorC family transporter [bacterium]